MNKPSAPKRGFSLVEMLIAIFILTVVMCTAIAAFSHLQAMGKKTEMVMTAANLARQRMEIAMREPFKTLNTLSETSQYIDQYGAAGGSDADFRRRTAITENYSGDNSLTQVTVGIYYKTYGYRMGGTTAFGVNILNGELLEKDWSPNPVEISTIMVDN